MPDAHSGYGLPLVEYWQQKMLLFLMVSVLILVAECV
jgi:hypothetical protein